jgi:putative Mg2+ transporter-C (MgtC) family protein
MTDPWVIENSHMLLRLLLSLALGGFIGYERERNNHAAGLRTHILVCLGSCLVMMLSMYGFSAFVDEPNVRIDPARLAAQVITGIGFLGAGTIVMTGRGISGLTTAASVWVVMAIGLSVGAGFYFPAVVGSLMVLFTLWGLNVVEKRYLNNRKEIVFWLALDDRTASLDRIQELLTLSEAKLRKVNFPESTSETSEDGVSIRRVQLTVLLNRKEVLLPLTDQLRQVAGVRSISAD